MDSVVEGTPTFEFYTVRRPEWVAGIAGAEQKEGM